MEKNKAFIKKFIIINLIIFCLIILGYKMYSLAYDISTYMTIYNNKNDYLNCDPSNVINKSVGVPNTTNDYQDYVVPYSGVWCLAETQLQNAGVPLKVYGIIDIGSSNNPTYTNIYSSKKGKTPYSDVKGASKNRKAQAAFTMLVGKNAKKDNIEGIANKHFYKTFNEVFEDDKSLNMFVNTNSEYDSSNTSTHNNIKYDTSSYGNAISNLRYGVGNGKGVVENSIDKKYLNKTAKTRVSGQTIYLSPDSTLVTSRTIEIKTLQGSTLNYTIKQDASDKLWYIYSGNTKKGRIVLSNSNIYLYDKVDVSAIKIVVNYDYIQGRLYMLIGTETQTRGISLGRWRSGNFSHDFAIDTSNLNVDVSMQKYIVKVNDNNLTSNNTSLTNRKNTYTFSTEPNSGVTKKTAKVESNSMQNETYKYNNIVNIEAGDTVTYRIHIYNNSDSRNVSDIKLDDRLPFYSSNNQIYSAVTVEKITQGTNNNDIKNSWTTYLKNEDGKNYTWIKKEDISLNAGGSTYFDVTLKFDKQINGIIPNTAAVVCSNNSAQYRTVDRDYVQMKKYSVSLEKFVSSVTDYKGDDGKYDYNRDGHRYNELLNDGNINKDPLKYNNKVEVEPGDLVTFTIRLKNTGELPVKVTEIYDSFMYNEVENGSLNGLKLEPVWYNGKLDLTGNGSTRGNTSNIYWYGNENNNNENKELNRYKIEFTNAVTIGVNSYEDIKIIFKVTVPDRLTNASQILQNKAGIVTIKNRNDVTVLDSDGIDNNYDMDWVKTKTYAVSLEKYISKVNNVSVPDVKYDVNGDGVVDLNDVELIRKYLANQPVSLNGKGDINADGTIDSNDVLALRKIIREGKPEYTIDKTDNLSKYKDVVTVQSEDTVTYTIKVKNDSEKTGVYINQITDTLDSKGFDNRTFNILSAKKYNKYGTELSNILSSVRDDTVDASNNIKTITIDCNNNTFLNSGDYISITVSVKVTEPNISLRTLPNTAKISGMKNKNNVTVKDTTPNNNKDSDYIKLDWTLSPPSDDTTSVTVTKEWIDDYNKYGVRPASVRVVLYKIVDGSKPSVGGAVTLLSPSGNKNTVSHIWTNLPKKENGKDIKYEVWEIRESGTFVQSGTKYNNDYKTYYVANSDNTIFTIKNIYEGITDDKTSVTVTKEWQDEENKYGKRPASIEVQLYKTVDGSTSPVGSKISLPSPSGNNNAVSYTWTNLPKKENGKNIKYTVKEVSVPDGYTVSYSSDTFHIINKYGVKTEDAVISGIVWNDIVQDKNLSKYDGLYQSSEQLLSGIGVLLYRNGVPRPIAKTTTDSNGYYYFNNYSIDTMVVTNPCEQYIKAPIKSTTDNKWAGTYYSYYVVFEYDGVTYTSTPDGKNCVDVNEYDNYKINSNAKEDGIIKNETRQQFNSRFNNINNGDCVKGINTDIYYKIEYSTKNDAGKAPQSNHIYNPRTMAIHSCTGLINFNKVKELTNNSDITTYEDKIKNVNLGLRGRDVFDLELTSDVVSTKVTVNGVDGTYNYGNKVTVRRNDLSSMYNVKEDMANVYGTGSQYIGEDYEQKVRKTDIKNDAYKDKGTGLEIYVTYRITVKNASQTPGAVTEIIDYYDSRYTFAGISGSDSGEVMSANDETPGQVIITKTNKIKYLNQSDSIYVDLTFKLKDESVKELFDLESGKILPTYNMAEISEYKTKCDSSQTEYTRGLIDKDSAPGSVDTEKVRLTSGNSTDTTLGYYFKAQNLQNLKYEDDTYAAPTLYFVSDDSKRTITGTVFEDITKLTEENVRTGNGIKDGDDPGVYGATVELIEGNTTRYTVKTNEKGEYTFSGFLPGNYTIKYTYGEKDETFIITSPNTKSYNGEDFQSTNNTENYGAAKLSDKQNYWYIDNETEKVSTATEDKDRRQYVSDYFIGDNSDEKITVLNNARDGNSADECKVTYGDDNSNEITANNVEENSYMFANTKNMTFEVEKVEDSDGKQHNSFADYVVEGMNFGIAEVPVTEINLQKSVKEFTIKDSTGSNTIAQLTKDDDGKWNVKGDVISAGNIFDVQIEDEKLQGARLQVTYDIIANMRTEKNFNNSKPIEANITGIVDFIDNNLSYNDALGENSKYWELTNFTETSGTFAEATYKEGTVPRGTIDPGGTKHTTIVKAKGDNPILLKEDGTAKAPITLEKILSSVDSTIDEIITSTVDTYEYSNIVEITGLDYTNVTDGGSSTNVLRDRIRTSDRYIILPGVQHDSATSEKITIHTPTGDSNVNIIYYVIAAVSLVVIAAGTFGIKKFVLKK